MKTVSAMFGTGKLFGVLLLILHLGICSNHGKESCEVQLYVKRHLVHNVLAGDHFKMECPVKYCASRPNVTWCKFRGTDCLPLDNILPSRTSWETKKNMSIFSLHFEPVLPRDNGSYRCSVNFSSHFIMSHSIVIHVTALANIADVTNTSGPRSTEEMAHRGWLFHSLLPVGALPLLIIACLCLICGLKRYQGKQKKPSDTAGREINLDGVPQPLSIEQTERSTRQNSKAVPSESAIYNNDPLFRRSKESEAYTKRGLEENKQCIVYASLNHSIIGRNTRQTREVQEAPTEYASICVKN
ncbi:B- and T-lymphocyte attenuator [Perognathus longimembris pacificus]|uniref:B- and T-lymphocyte attenuator n=1 Tax=Perognathus longimembris pacificus TaxID=214514 RepID=UPI002018750A|nr:B- and T-lymphocyte attenuator [Perognathus longimembris pacificus]